MQTDAPVSARSTLLIGGSHIDRLKARLGQPIDVQRLVAPLSADGATVSAH